jgi:hypothetical protein
MLPALVIAEPELMTHAVVRTFPSRLLNFSLWASTGVGSLVVALGVLAMAEDASTHGEEWDGLGLFVGKLLVAGGLLWLLPHVVLALWLVRARRRGHALTLVGLASVALSAALLSPLLLLVAVGDAQLTTLFIPVCVCVLVLVTGLLVVADSSQ